MDRGAWRAAVHEVTKSRTGVSDFTLVTEQQQVGNQFMMIHWECSPLGFCGGQVIERGRGREEEGRDKRGRKGTSLVVQWLRLHAPSAGGPRFDPSSGN